MQLHYRSIGEGQPFVILHGLFGYSDNWQTFARKISEYYQVILVDQRNHGHSGWSDSHSYLDMSNDLFELCEQLQLKNIILLGHSMGGKTAMTFAENHENLLDKLIIADMGIKAYPPHHQTILEGLNSLKLEQYESRGEADDALKQYIDSFAVRQFLLKNLYWKEKGQLAWRMNLAVLEKAMPDILKAFTPNHIIKTPTLFLKGEMSNYLLSEDWESIEDVFVDSELIEIKKAGHWLHAERPKEFLEAVLTFCLE